MFINLILIFTILPAIELALLIKLGTIVGVVNTLLVIILTGVTGAYLARMQGFIILNKIQTSLNEGIMPSNELIDGLFILVGGIVLLTPGLITDAMGFLFLIPLTRNIFKKWLMAKMQNVVKEGQTVRFSSFQQNKSRYDDFDLN